MRLKAFCLKLCLLLLLSFLFVACDSTSFPTSSPSSPETDVPSPDASPPEAPSEPSDGNPETLPEIEPGQLTAGEWRDLDNWDFWLELMKEETWLAKQSHWGFYPMKKVSVIVTSDDAKVTDAQLRLQDKNGDTIWENRTDNQGRAVLFPELFDTLEAPYALTVNSGDSSSRIEDVQMNTKEALTIDLASSANPNTLDLMFVIDTTGSMSDELQYLSAELQDVITRVEQATSNLKLRLSANYYRDEGDAYVVRSFPFTEDISSVVNQMREQRANGGGDYPEAVEQALEDAIQNHAWSSEARARLLFLVLDAPPHHTQAIVSKMQTLTKAAAKQGIRIIPLASSGVDKDTEFLLRFLSIGTDATYTFLTNHSGIGNEKIEPTIGEYQVDLLNDLLVKIINQYVK